MPSLEAVCTRLFGRPGWIPKVLLGGGLSFIPGLNLFALGYLFIYGRQLRRSGRVDLPEWSEMNWPELFVCGLRLFGLLILYIGLPMLVGWIVSLLLYFLTFGLLGVVAYFPLAICGFFSPMFFLSAFMAYLKHEEFRDAFQIRILAARSIVRLETFGFARGCILGNLPAGDSFVWTFFFYRCLGINCLFKCPENEEFFLTSSIIHFKIFSYANLRLSMRGL